MKPVTCLTNNDCVRACIASILELEAMQVPHFFEVKNEAETEKAHREMQEWLTERGFIAAVMAIPGTYSFDEFKQYMNDKYNGYYMLWCDSAGQDHAVIGYGGSIVHNPAWYRQGIDGPHSSGFWLVWVIARLT